MERTAQPFDIPKCGLDAHILALPVIMGRHRAQRQAAHDGDLWHGQPLALDNFSDVRFHESSSTLVEDGLQEKFSHSWSFFTGKILRMMLYKRLNLGIVGGMTVHQTIAAKKE